MFFRQDLYRREVGGKTGAMQLVGLLRLVSFGDKDEAMTIGKFAERRRYIREEFDLVFGDGLSEAFDAVMLFFSHRGVAELLEACDQRFMKAVKSVAMGANGVVLDSIEVTSNLFSGVDAMIEIGDETGDRALEVDVVFPKGVVCINEEGLIIRTAADQSRGAHGLIIKVPWRVRGAPTGTWRHGTLGGYVPCASYARVEGEDGRCSCAEEIWNDLTSDHGSSTNVAPEDHLFEEKIGVRGVIHHDQLVQAFTVFTPTLITNRRQIEA
jgi:hypothetical protein